MDYNGLLTFSSSVTESIFMMKKDELNFSWDGEEVGPIDKITNRVSTRISMKLYYCASGYYFYLEHYSELQHRIEILKTIFDIPRTGYNICTVGSKKYFMYYCEPDYERPGKLSKSNKFTDDFKIIALFHWIIGINGHFWVHEKDGKHTVFSKGPYYIDLSSVDISKQMANRIFDTNYKKENIMCTFDDPEKLDLLNDFIAQEVRWWYLKIIKRIDELT